MDGREVSATVSGNSATGEGRTLGNCRRHVGRARSQYARWRVAHPPNSDRQAILQEEIRCRREDRLESGLLWIQLATAADLQEVRHRLFRHAKAFVGA